MNRHALPAILLAACAGVGCASAADLRKGVIREGVGIAGVRLGMTVAEVEKKLGAPVMKNAGPDGAVVFLSYHETQNFGVYVDAATQRVKLIIVSVEGGGFCTRYKACLYREGDLAKIKAKHGAKLVRFVDRDQSVYYRLPGRYKGKPVMTEYTPVEERNGVVQAAISWWDRPVDASMLD